MKHWGRSVHFIYHRGRGVRNTSYGGEKILARGKVLDSDSEFFLKPRRGFAVVPFDRNSAVSHVRGGDLLALADGPLHQVRGSFAKT